MGAALGFEGLTHEDLVAGPEPARALRTAMYDLAKVGLVEFKNRNVDFGNSLTPSGRDLLDDGAPQRLARDLRDPGVRGLTDVSRSAAVGSALEVVCSGRHRDHRRA